MLTERIPSHQEEHPMKIPGVSVEEAPFVPLAVVPVDTAIPVFIGYTEKAIDPEGCPLANVLQRIESPADYEQFFGGAYRETLYVDVTQAAGAPAVARFVDAPAGTIPAPTLTMLAASSPVPFFLPSFLLHYSVALFYANGGGPCFVFSVGPYAFRDGAPDISSAALEGAFPILEAHVGPTLIVIPDACRLSLTAVSTDIQTVADIATAALAHCRKMQDRFAIIDVPVSQAAIVPGAASTVLEADIGFRSHLTDDVEQLKYGAAYYPYVQSLLPYVTSPDNVHVTSTLYEGTLASAQTTHPDVYDAVNRLVGETQALLPPGGVVAGYYARVDSIRGVWTAPAGGVPIEAVAGPIINVTDAFGEILGSDPSGKSINVIRSITGRGTFIWGARTLAGNDGDDRYVNVRRFLIFVAQSIEKATARFVFEVNDADTWTSVRGMTDNFLATLWRTGALAGNKPEQAFTVAVGLGTTMTPQDILDGKMIVVIGVAVVRPAEFIVLRIGQWMPKP
jgi:phage tail sheath protein FI